MSDCPLNRDVWKRFIEGRLSAGERDELIRHLEGNCADCETFFEGLGPEAAWQGLQWASDDISDRLADKFQADSALCDDVFSGIMSGIKSPAMKRPMIRKWLPAFAPAALVAVLFIIIAHHYPKPTPYDGIKGMYIEAPSISLQVAVLKGDSTSGPERGIPGELYRPEDTLFFRYELGTRGFIYLVRTDGRDIQILDSPDPAHPVAQEKGVYDYREEGRPLGLPLRGLEGRQVFAVVLSKKPLRAKEVESLVREYLGRKATIHSPDWAVDGLEIHVGR